MNPYVVLAAIIVTTALLGGAYYQGDSNGYARAESENSEALAERDKKIEKLKADHVLAVQAFQTQINQTRNQADAKLRKLLAENNELQKMWNLVLLDGVVDYAWGVHTAVDRRAVPH